MKNQGMWDAINEVCQKQTQKLIDMKYITLNKVVSLNGVSSQFANGMAEYFRDEEKREDMSTFITLLSKYFPDKLDLFIKK